MSTDTTEAVDYKRFVGKKVVVVYVPEEGKDAIEVEGTLEAANAMGLMFKPKGKVKVDIIDSTQVQDVRPISEPAKKLEPKTLKVVTYGQARSHLLERHGYTLAQVNGMSEEQAFDIHSGIDHKAADLGHNHGNASETPAAQAVAAESSTS